MPFCLKEQFTCGKLNWKLLKRSVIRLRFINFPSNHSSFILTKTVSVFICSFIWFEQLATSFFVSSANILGDGGGGDKRKMKTKTAEREQRERDEFMSWWISRRRLLFLCTSCKFVNANDVIDTDSKSSERRKAANDRVCACKKDINPQATGHFSTNFLCWFWLLFPFFMCSYRHQASQIYAAQCC